MIDTAKILLSIEDASKARGTFKYLWKPEGGGEQVALEVVPDFRIMTGNGYIFINGECVQVIKTDLEKRLDESRDDGNKDSGQET